MPDETQDQNADDAKDETAIDPAAHEALAKAHERLKRDAKADRDALKEMKDRLDAIEAEKAKAEEEKAEKDKDVEGLRKQLEAKHAREITAANERADKAEAQVRALVLKYSLSTALDDARVKTELKAGAAAVLERGVEIKDEDGEPVAYKGGLPLADAVKLWAESDEGKPYILAGNSGGGAPGGRGGKDSGPNPFKAGSTFSITEQTRIFREDPEKAKRLAAEAGVSLAA